MIRRKLAYLGLLATSWMVMRLYLFRVTAVLFYTLLLFLPLLFLLFHGSARKTKVAISIPKQVVEKNEMFCLRFHVQGKNNIPKGPVVVWLLHKNCIAGKWKRKKIVLVNGGQESYELYAKSEYCAQFVFRIRRARVYDAFQIFSRRVKLLVDESLQKGVTVLPEAAEVADWPVRANPNVMVESEVYSDTKSGDDVSEVFDIRDYVPGDRFNRIHWKLTSKMDRLMVKELGLPIDCSVLVFLDLSAYDRGGEFLKYRDALFCALISLSGCMLAQGQIHYIAWNAADGTNEKRQVTCEEDLYEVIGRLLYEPAGGWKENAAVTYLSEYSNDQYTNIFYLIASKNPQDGTQAMVQMRKSAWLTLLLFDGHEAVKALSQAFPPDIHVAYLSAENAKEEMETAFLRGEDERWQGN